MANVQTASRLLGASLLLLSRGHPAAGSEQPPLRSGLRGMRGVALDAAPEAVEPAAAVACDGNDRVFRLDLRPRDGGCEAPWILERDRGAGRYVRVAGPETARAATGMCLRDGEYRITINDECGDASDAPEGHYAVVLDGEEVLRGGILGTQLTAWFTVPAGSFTGKVPFAEKRPASKPPAFGGPIPALASATASKLDALLKDDDALILAMYTDPDHEETVYNSEPEELTEPIIQIDNQDATVRVDHRDAGDDPLDVWHKEDVSVEDSTAEGDETQASAPSADTEEPPAEPIVPLEEQDAINVLVADDVSYEFLWPGSDAQWIA